MMELTVEEAQDAASALLLLDLYQQLDAQERRPVGPDETLADIDARLSLCLARRNDLNRERDALLARHRARPLAAACWTFAASEGYSFTANSMPRLTFTVHQPPTAAPAPSLDEAADYLASQSRALLGVQ